MPSVANKAIPMSKKSTLRTILCPLLLATLAFVAGCDKDGVRRLPVSIQSFTTSGKVWLDSHKPVWNDLDQVNISGYDETINVTNSTVSVTSDDETLYACYPASAVTAYANAAFDITLPTVQYYAVDASGHQRVTAPMAATGTERLDFYNLCALVEVQVPDGMRVKYIDLATVDSVALSGSGRVTFVGGTPAFAFTAGQTRPYTRLDCGSGVVRDDNRFYVTVPAVSGQQFQITLCIVDGGRLYRRTVTQRSAANLAVSQYGPALLSYNRASMTDITPANGGLCEAFSLGSTTQAYFASGNLQYRASNGGAWRIATTQYAVIGADNSNISSSYDGWIDLFGWGTTGTEWGGAYPWRSDNNPGLYAVNNNLSSNMDASSDWGPNIASGWRTPTHTEWEYLINGRPGAADKKAAAVVGNMRGLVLLPDYWMLPDGCTFTTSDTNRYTTSQWVWMEAFGALFLPAAGRRAVTEVNYVNEKSWYWSSEVNAENTGECYALKVLDASNSGVAEVLSRSRWHGNAVRLVKNR